MSVSKDTNYDSFAEIYLASTDKKPYTTYYERPYIIKKLPPVDGKVVLDLGCATGFYSKQCLDNGAEVISIDTSKKMINHTLKLCENKIKAYVHDIAEPFTFLNSSSIDIAICSLVFHYIENWDETLEELYRVLRPGGKCIISTHHPVNDYTIFNQTNYFMKRLIEDEWKGFEKPIQVKYFVRPLNEYIQPLLKCNLKLKEMAEPKPVDILKEINEKMHFQLSNKPTFLFFILEKEE